MTHCNQHLTAILSSVSVLSNGLISSTARLSCFFCGKIGISETMRMRLRAVRRHWWHFIEYSAFKAKWFLETFFFFYSCYLICVLWSEAVYALCSTSRVMWPAACSPSFCWWHACWPPHSAPLLCCPSSVIDRLSFSVLAVVWQVLSAAECCCACGLQGPAPAFLQ